MASVRHLYKIENQFAAVSIASSNTNTPYKNIEINSDINNNSNEITSPLMYQTSVATSNEKSKNAFEI
jgi:hypothetical protein